MVVEDSVEVDVVAVGTGEHRQLLFLSTVISGITFAYRIRKSKLRRVFYFSFPAQNIGISVAVVVATEVEEDTVVAAETGILSAPVVFGKAFFLGRGSC